jgi:hypothetical protein
MKSRLTFPNSLIEKFKLTHTFYCIHTRKLQNVIDLNIATCAACPVGKKEKTVDLGGAKFVKLHIKYKGFDGLSNSCKIVVEALVR